MPLPFPLQFNVRSFSHVLLSQRTRRYWEKKTRLPTNRIWLSLQRGFYFQLVKKDKSLKKSHSSRIESCELKQRRNSIIQGQNIWKWNFYLWFSQNLFAFLETLSQFAISWISNLEYSKLDCLIIVNRWKSWALKPNWHPHKINQHWIAAFVIKTLKIQISRLGNFSEGMEFRKFYRSYQINLNIHKTQCLVFP